MEMTELFETGMQLQCHKDDRPASIKVILSNIVGDNLGLQTIFGLCGLACDSFCRFCLATTATRQNLFKESDFTLRTPDDYDRLCRYH